MFYRKHSRVSLDCGTIQITKQSHKQECDIYSILKQYQKTGIINHITNLQPEFTDLPSNLDYQSSLNTILAAQSTFDALPAKVRDHFHNDPARFLGAFSDPSQEAALREYGFLNPSPPAPEPPSSAPTSGAPGA